MAPDDQPELDPFLADAVRDVFVRPVDEVTARRHVSVIAAAARTGAEPVARRPRGRRRMWRPILAATAATLVLPVGLAVAGVSLPGAVERPYRAVGIELPHQTRDVHPAPARRPVTHRTPPTTSTTAEPAHPRPAEQRPRRRAGDGQEGRAKRRGAPVDPAGRQHKSRRSSVRPAPGAGARQTGPRGATGIERKPPSRRPSARPRPARSNRPTSPRPPRTKGASGGSDVTRTSPRRGAAATG